ncbi:MAG: porin [Verrucomicrobiota bacterium]
MIRLKAIPLIIAATVAIVAATAGAVRAGDAGKSVLIEDPLTPPEEAWSFCDLFDFGQVYESEKGFIKSFTFIGRYQGQYISQDEDIGDTSNSYNRWQHRRARFGAEIEMAGNLTFEAENNMADNEGIFAGRVQNNWQNFFLRWEPEDDLSLTVGKDKQGFTIEDETSSKRILTVERSPIVQETAGARPWGTVVRTDLAGFDTRIGAWITGGDDSWGSWPQFDSNLSLSLNTAYEMFEGTDLRFDYVYNDNKGGTERVQGDADRSFASAYQHGISVGTLSDWGNLGLVTNVIVAKNRAAAGRLPDKSDTWGAVVMPSYYITDKLQAVFRYAYMKRGREQRTQRFDVRATVSNYHTFLGGLTYYICEDKLKVMAGYEYAIGDVFEEPRDIDSGTWMFAVRTYF